MPIQFACPQCGKSTMVGDEYAGQSGPCAGCGATITIPGGDAFAKQKIAKSNGAPILAIIAILGVGFVFCGGAAVALLLPAGQATREAARRVSCSNNLKMIAIAMHNYHDMYGEFPPAYTVDENGDKLHSWRALLLPYMEEQALYNRIDFSKPWDDPVNRPIADAPVRCYLCPSNPVAGATTHYVAVVGPSTVLQPGKSSKLAQITDGTSNTVMVVEVRKGPASWMEPTDLDAAQMKMLINNADGEISSYHPVGAQVALADGSVQFLAEAIDSGLLQSLLTRDGGEAVKLP